MLFVGYAGKIGFGLSALWIALGNTLIGGLLAWVVLARRTRLMTTRLGAETFAVGLLRGEEVATTFKASIAPACSAATARSPRTTAAGL